MKWLNFVLGASLFLLIGGGSTFFIIKAFNQKSKLKQQVNDKFLLQEKNKGSEKTHKKQFKKVIYNNRDYTFLFNDILFDEKEFPSKNKLKILEANKIIWQSNQYKSNAAIPANYDGHNLGMIGNIYEINNHQFTEITNFSEKLFKVIGKEEGKAETRKSVYQICQAVFSYYVCDVKPAIVLPYKNFGEMTEGSPPDVDLKNPVFVSKLLTQYPSVKSKLVKATLIHIKTQGNKGKKMNLGSLYYANRTIMKFTDSIKNIEDFKKTKYSKTLTFLLNPLKFIPCVDATFPTYKGVSIRTIEKGKPEERLTQEEKLMMLGWKEELLEFE